MNELKIGDKLLCKRNMSNNSKHEKFFFLRGNFYEVKRVYGKFVIHDHKDYNAYSSIIEVINERGSVSYFKDSGPQNIRLYRYFHTPRQIRKIKLDAIESR